jgi:branched-chain amino acid transport system substrate-binding protein
MVRRWFSAALITFLTTAAALAADAPAEIKLGTLYASSGRFASISMPVPITGSSCGWSRKTPRAAST